MKATNRSPDARETWSHMELRGEWPALAPCLGLCGALILVIRRPFPPGSDTVTGSLRSTLQLPIYPPFVLREPQKKSLVLGQSNTTLNGLSGQQVGMPRSWTQCLDCAASRTRCAPLHVGRETLSGIPKQTPNAPCSQRSQPGWPPDSSHIAVEPTTRTRFVRFQADTEAPTEDHMVLVPPLLPPLRALIGCPLLPRPSVDTFEAQHLSNQERAAPEPCLTPPDDLVSLAWKRDPGGRFLWLDPPGDAAVTHRGASWATNKSVDRRAGQQGCLQGHTQRGVIINPRSL